MQNKALVLDLVAWVAAQPRSYREVMEAWRSTCPRLTVWEDTLDAGLVRVRSDEGAGQLVCITEAGSQFLRASGRE